MRRHTKLAITTFLCAILAALYTNCSGSNLQSAAIENRPQGGSVKVTQLGQGSYPAGGDLTYRLLKLEVNGKSPTYAEWISNGKSTRSAAVLLSDPYSGVGWTDNAIDQKWATRPNASTGYVYADEDGPNFNPATSSSLGYQLIPPVQVGDQGAFALLNGASVLIVHGRFYAGGTLENEVDEIVTGLRFLAEQPEVDRNRIGIFGSSWGAFEAIHGSARSPSTARPIAGVAIAPPTNFVAQLQYLQQSIPTLTSPAKLAEYQDFFDPYVRRILASNYANFSTSFLATNLKTPFLVIHDQWDTLIPHAQSVSLKEAKPALIELLQFPHETGINFNTFALDHQQSTEGMTTESAFALAQIYLFNRIFLQAEPKMIYTDAAKLMETIAYFRQKQLAGIDISWLKPRLVEMCAPNLSIVDSSTGESATGPLFLATAMTLWGWNQTENTVCAYLANHNL